MLPFETGSLISVRADSTLRSPWPDPSSGSPLDLSAKGAGGANPAGFRSDPASSRVGSPFSLRGRRPEVPSGGQHREFSGKGGSTPSESPCTPPGGGAASDPRREATERGGRPKPGGNRAPDLRLPRGPLTDRGLEHLTRAIDSSKKRQHRDEDRAEVRAIERGIASTSRKVGYES